MRILRDPAEIAQLEDTAVRDLIEQRIREISEFEPFDPDLMGYFILVEPGDGIDVLEAETGFPILRNLFDDTPYGDDDFSPSFEWAEEHDAHFELVYILNDGGFAVDIVIQKQAGVDERLLAMCACYATPPPAATINADPTADNCDQS